MLLHGIAKIRSGVDRIANLMVDAGLPGALAYGAYIGEVLAPIMVLIGYRTRLAAPFIAFTMIVAVHLRHSDELLSFSNGWGIELQGFYFFLSIALFSTGSGKYAISTSNKWD